MMRLAMSRAASGLLRALIARSGVARDRILLSEWTSTDWQSLTFVGERHEARLRICGGDSYEVVRRITTGLEDAEMHIGGHIVADISVTESTEPGNDGSVLLTIEALTVEE